MATGMLAATISGRILGPMPGGAAAVGRIAPLRESSAGVRFALTALGACFTSLFVTAHRRMQKVNTLLAGGTFGLGLAISGMTHQTKVLGFLNLAGQWNPSLAFVMAGGLAVSAAGHALYQSRSRKPLLADSCNLPKTTDIDARLLGGAALFGAGWGFGGLCPGPAIANLSAGLVGAPNAGFVGLYVACIGVGMLLADKIVGTGNCAPPSTNTKKSR